MSDWVTVTTNFDYPLGVPDGNLVAWTIVDNLLLAGGQMVPAFRQSSPVVAGVALIQIPITSDAKPPGAMVYFTYLDANNRASHLGGTVITRPTSPPPWATIQLSALFPAGTE